MADVWGRVTAVEGGGAADLELDEELDPEALDTVELDNA